jgi:hypothetical protein
LALDGGKASFGDLNGRPSSCCLADQLISFSRQFLNFPPRPRDFTFRSLDRRFMLSIAAARLWAKTINTA